MEGHSQDACHDFQHSLHITFPLSKGHNSILFFSNKSTKLYSKVGLYFLLKMRKEYAKDLENENIECSEEENEAIVEGWIQENEVAMQEINFNVFTGYFFITAENPKFTRKLQ